MVSLAAKASLSDSRLTGPAACARLHADRVLPSLHVRVLALVLVQLVLHSIACRGCGSRQRLRLRYARVLAMAGECFVEVCTAVGASLYVVDGLGAAYGSHSACVFDCASLAV